MIVIQPVCDTLRHCLPVRAILPHVLAAPPIELSDTQLFDELFAAKVRGFFHRRIFVAAIGRNKPRLQFALQFLFNFDFDRQAVCVPARFAQHQMSLHCAMAAEKIFDGARKHMMNTRTTIGRWRSFKKHVRLRTCARGQRTRKQILRAPTREYSLLERVGTEISRN